jgi:hypothetical protein
MTTDVFTARAVARLRHPAGTALDAEKLSPRETELLLHALAQNRTRLRNLRTAAARRMREAAADLDRIDRQLDDIEQSETWLLS